MSEISQHTNDMRRHVASRKVQQVTYIGNFLSAHGLNPTYAEALAPRLRECGMNVVASSSRTNGFQRLLDMARAVAAAPARAACVIIDLYSGPRAYWAAIAIAQMCRALRRRYIVTLHGGNLPQRLENSKTSLLSVLRAAALVTSPSAYLARSFERFLPVNIIPNGLDLSAYSFRARGPVQPRCLYLRAFHKYYDPLTAIRAFAGIRMKYPTAVLRMVGPDEDGTLAGCRKLVSELKLETAVELSGRIPKADIPRLCDSFDIFINSSVVDNTPLSTIEAMAMGMCIVATTAGGLPCLLEHGKTALMVPPGNYEQMGDAILRLLTNPEMASQLSRNARTKAETMDWSCVLPLWDEAINRVCAAPGD